MKKIDKINIKILTGYAILIIIATLSWAIGTLLVTAIKKEAQESSILNVEGLPSQFPDYDAIKGKHPDPKIKILNITGDCPPAGCVNDKPATVDFDGIKKEYEVSGKFARAYLYIEALVDDNRPLTNWDDVYFSLNNQGGHLISQESSLPVPPGDVSRYLYDLRSISYYPMIRDKERKINKMTNVDFFNFLQDKTILNILVSISSNRPGRVMKEVSIYYECLEGSICNIEEIKSSS